MNKILICLSLALCTACTQDLEYEDLSLTAESEVLSHFVRAAVCLTLKATPEEKARLIEGMPFIDSRATYSNVEEMLLADDWLDAISRTGQAIFEILPRRCPKTAASITPWTNQLDVRTLAIYDLHFKALVSRLVAVDIASKEANRRNFEFSYMASGIDESPYSLTASPPHRDLYLRDFRIKT